MKNIRAIPLDYFFEQVSNEYIKAQTNWCFISILDPSDDLNDSKYDKTLDNFLQVKMWDVKEDIYCDGELIYEKPTDEALQQITDFINKHSSKQAFIIHCTAGISRSGAVARFVFDKFAGDVDVLQFNEGNKYIRPNQYILERLKEIDYEK